jgi:hypothetical protein
MKQIIFLSILFEQRGIVRTHWDYKGGFAIISRGVPQTEITNTILGKP